MSNQRLRCGSQVSVSQKKQVIQSTKRLQCFKKIKNQLKAVVILEKKGVSVSFQFKVLTLDLDFIIQ